MFEKVDRNLPRTILFLCVYILSFQTAYSQNKLSGRITDPTGEPLPSATIYITGLQAGTLADSTGGYTLLNLPNGLVSIEYSFVGYARQIKTVDFGGQNVELNISMKPSPVEAEEIVVSGRYSSTQHTNAVKIDVLKLKPLEFSGTPNFSEVLTQVPGIDMISKGSGIAKPVIRGLSMNDILILNNGVRFENYQYSSHHPLGIDEFGIEGVEIIKGPASLLYGSDAIGGVINFIKEKPAPVGTFGGDYNLQFFSNTLGVNNNLGIKGSSQKVFGSIRIGQKSHADFLQGGGAFVANSRFNEYSLQATTGYHSKIGSFQLNYDQNNQKLGLVEEEAVIEISTRGRTNQIWFQQFNTHLLSSKNKLFLGNARLNLNVAFQNTGLAHIGEADQYEIRMRLNTLTYEANVQLNSGKTSEYIFGLQGLNQSNANLNNRETILLPDALTGSWSAYGLFQRTFFNKLRLQAGVRYDIKTVSTQSVGLYTDTLTYRPPLDKNYASFSGSVGAIFNISEEFLIRANFAKGYRTPNLAELTSKGPHELRFETGNPDLLPENSYESDVSVHLHKSNFICEVAAFYNIVDQYIFIAPTGKFTASKIQIYNYRQANSVLFGGEAGVHFHPDPIPWLHSKGTFSTVTGKQDNGDFLPFIPANKIRFELRAEKEKILSLKTAFIQFDTQTAFGQNNPAPEETRTPGYTLLNLSFGGDIPLKKQLLSVSINLNNLLDTQYIDHLSTLKEVSFFDPGRNISLNIRIPFTF